MTTKENTFDNNELASPSRLKPPSKSALSTQSISLIPKLTSIASNNSFSTYSISSIKDNSQILLSPQFKNRKNTEDNTNSSSSSNLLPTNQIQVGIKNNNVSSRASYVDPNTVKTSKVSFPLPQPPLLLSSKNKRAKWDTKGLLEDAMEDLKTYKSEYLKLAQQYKESVDRLTELEFISTSLESSIQGTTSEKLTLKEKLDLMEQSLSMNEQKYDLRISQITSEFTEQLSATKETNYNLSRSLELSRRELDLCNSEILKLKSTIEAQNSTLTVLEGAKVSLNNLLANYQTKEQEYVSKISNFENEVSSLKEFVDALKLETIEGEKIRKRLHNEVQELKGNIRVFCRVRPALTGKSMEFYLGIEKSEEPSSFVPCEPEIGNVQIFFPTDPLMRTEGIELSQWIEPTSGLTKPQLRSHSFVFDRVFEPASTQSDVFEEISQLVQSVLDGYKVCIFAYGQTGSGKTFTMEGPSGVTEDLSSSGMIPRAVTQVFETSRELSIKKGWNFSLEASFLEIYNETIKDLLAPSCSTSEKLEIKHNPNTGKTSVTELTIVSVNSISQVNRLLKKASENRSIGETRCNERSSRSHSVFTLYVTGENTMTSEKVEGILNLIDLAGSERLSSSGATGDRLKETQAINKSLSALGDVIMALANKEAHIPYRNSKLTYLLQNSLGGNSKTLMFVNISPAKESFNESLCSLRFAAKVNSCHIGTARKNTS